MISGQDHYLWAGLILLCFNLLHFTRQRKLPDQNTKTFLIGIVLGMLVCAMGIVMSAAESGRFFLGEKVTLCLLSGTAVVQVLLPYELLRFISSRLGYDANRERRIDLLGLIPVLAFILLAVLNIPMELFWTVTEEGQIQLQLWHFWYVNGLLLYYLFDLSYLLAYRREMERQSWNVLMEASGIMLFGLVIEYYFRVDLFFGFPLALSISLLHLTIKNPNAYIDQGTHVFSDRYFGIWMAEKLAAARKGALVAIDLYQMNQITRLYADGTGAEFEANVAETLWRMETVPHVFRLMRGRFAIWTETEKEADQLLEACATRLNTPFQIEGQSVRCPAVVLKISLDEGKMSMDELMSYISFCLQRASGQDEIQVVRDNPELRASFEYELEIERFFKEAMEKDLFQVWYQPVFSLHRRQFVSLEALSRLKHPQLGWISPELFIRIAARRGLLPQIMPRQLERICRFARENRKMFRFIRNIKINLSPQELAEPEYCEKLLNIIRENGLPMTLFQFELTENTATEYSKELDGCIQRLRRAGVGLCLDDFGSGYANLNAVMRLPFSVIKLDRSLLTGICEDGSVSVFYQNMVFILNQLGYSVIAEGVEKRQEVDLLSMWGVDLIQGYYFSAPLPPDQLLEMLSASNP